MGSWGVKMSCKFVENSANALSEKDVIVELLWSVLFSRTSAFTNQQFVCIEVFFMLMLSAKTLIERRREIREVRDAVLFRLSVVRPPVPCDLCCPCVNSQGVTSRHKVRLLRTI